MYFKEYFSASHLCVSQREGENREKLGCLMYTFLPLLFRCNGEPDQIRYTALNCYHNYVVFLSLQRRVSISYTHFNVKRIYCLFPVVPSNGFVFKSTHWQCFINL